MVSGASHNGISDGNFTFRYVHVVARSQKQLRRIARNHT